MGDHNILNGTASIIVSLISGINISIIKKSLLNYTGVKRRFSYLGKINKSLIFDDYAHHPTEINATLLAAQNISKDIVIVFQPHRYSRTSYLMSDFVKSLSKVKKLYLLKTYSAGEKIIKTSTSKNLFLKIHKKNKNVVYVDNENKLKKYLHQETLKNQIIIFMGAGSISRIANKFIEK